MTSVTGPRSPLDAAKLRDLSASELDVEVLGRAPSTNAEVTARARAGAAAGLVVVAEHQTAGRGRLDRTWETPAHAALTFSLLLRPPLPAADWTWLPLLAGVAVAETLRELGVPADLKWPNDVLIEGRKVAGLLVERVETPAGPAAVVGIGLNVSQQAAELPIEAATSLVLEGIRPDRTELLASLLRRLQREYADWVDAGVPALRASYLRLCPTVAGLRLRVDLPGGEAVTGIGTGLSDDGGLVVRTADGDIVVHAGDVVHVRPGDVLHVRVEG
jgi:BirA family biotin operon repressor/biotin-[acetyl-CoA-carboxylase] ligase